LGPIFDLINFVPIVGADPNVKDDDSNNPLTGVNVDVIALEIPIACITGASPVIAVWAATRELYHSGATHTPGRQVSRLGNPLVNEIVIGLRDKGAFNRGYPTGDLALANYVLYPTLPEIVTLLFLTKVNAAFNGNFTTLAPATPRNDLLSVFINGITGLNEDGGTCEMMRLNTSIAITAAKSQNNLGVIGGDNAGYPNGRRPGDDVVDISLRVVMGVLVNGSPVGTVPFTDFAPVNAGYFDTTWPYLKTPLPGAVTPKSSGGDGGSAASTLSSSVMDILSYLF